MWDFSSSFLGAFSIVFCTAGILALLLLPVLAKNTYIFENALMPGYGNPMLSSQDVSEANKWVKDIIALNSKSQGAGISTCRSQAHVSRGFDFVFSVLTRVTWLAKDLIWLGADSQHGEYAAVAAWLREYHTPLFTKLRTADVEICLEINNVREVEENPIAERQIYDEFRSAGTMAAALVIKVVDKKEHSEDSLSIYAEASNRQMPNLDLINIVNYLAVHRQGLWAKVDKMWSVLDSKWLKILGELFESAGQVARSLNPLWKFEIWGLLIVPMCLLAHPLKLDLRVPSSRNFSRVSCNLVLGFMGFPPATFMVFKGTFEGFSSIDVGDFRNWLESLWAWNSAAYLFVDQFVVMALMSMAGRGPDMQGYDEEEMMKLRAERGGRAGGWSVELGRKRK
ncbi:hypothetical protein FEM48_Zijuj01G0191200 [Ziziphus jujuba var. spinosa]|uniref:Uncharacterized protein n=1 Tax=Ziziphus jujuba var. spinosa TaxID=714518 RepID=A0A978W314_ZIZJJ|nr:hypothetical protein FEM48_Zijuj01G0191200 [Ziziphus jujuba var. spinosa]